jgi:hypothetical protein
MNKKIDRINLSVTLAAYAELVRENTIFMSGKEAEQLENIVVDQIECLVNGNEKDWHGWEAFTAIKRKYNIP